MAGTYASGRYRCSRRTKAEACLALDVNRLKRAGCLRPGWCGSWEWRHADEPVAAIDLYFEGNLLYLAYNVCICGVLEDVAEAVRIVHTPCRFGGSQPYFICPRDTCQRRATKLYGAGRYFLCHHCHRLVHASQYDTPLRRAVRRARKAEQRLGDMSLPKPKGAGMWLRTYARVLDRALATASQVDEAVVRELQRLLELAEADEKRMIRNRPSRERKVSVLSEKTDNHVDFSGTPQESSLFPPPMMDPFM